MALFEWKSKFLILKVLCSKTWRFYDFKASKTAGPTKIDFSDDEDLVYYLKLYLKIFWIFVKVWLYWWSILFVIKKTFITIKRTMKKWNKLVNLFGKKLRQAFSGHDDLDSAWGQWEGFLRGKFWRWIWSKTMSGWHCGPARSDIR